MKEMNKDNVINTIKNLLQYYFDYIYEVSNKYVAYKIRDIKVEITFEYNVERLIFKLNNCNIYIVDDIKKLDKAIIEDAIERNVAMFRERQFNRLSDYMDEINVCPDDISEQV